MAVSAQGNSEQDLAILQSCVGFLLFGVPNRGLDASNLAALVRGQKNARLIADLNQASPLLLHIDHAFQRSLAYKGCLVVSFYETKDSNTVNVRFIYLICVVATV
jgi:hypothetical protein